MYRTSSENSSGEDEHSEDRRGHSMAAPELLVPGNRTRTACPRMGEVRGLDESAKTEWSDEDCDTKVSTLMCL